jgi:tetratricopeptide (TPR) repeat protein
VKRTKKTEYALAASIALVTMLVYLPALHNNFVAWDDILYVTDNSHIRSLGGSFFLWAFSDFFAANWHPLTWISHALDYAVWGLNPLGHHLTSIILHALNTFLVVALLIRLLDAYRTKHDPSFLNDRAVLVAGGTAGLLFGLHPLHVESVAWVSERKDLLCALFFLLSIMLYAKYASGRTTGDGKRQPDGDGKDGAGGRNFLFNRYYLAALGFFILALLSKPMAVTLPVVLLILDWHPFDRIRSWRTFGAACVEKLPFFVLSLASSVMTVLAQKAGGALLSVAVTPWQTRLPVGAKAVIGYLENMAWPLNLVPFYPYPETASWASWEYIAPLALEAGITVLCVVLAVQKRKTGLAAWGYYCATLVPVLGIVQVGGQSMADRYTYLPSLGPFIVLGLGAAWVWERAHAQDKPGPSVRLFIAAAAACIVFFLSFATIRQTGVWKDSLSLWSYEIAREPGVALAYNNRGLTYDDMGRLDLAVEDFTRAIELSPFEYKAYSNRGKAFSKLGMLDKAIEDFTVIINQDPSSYWAYVNRGKAYYNKGRIDQAIDDYNKAINLNPSELGAYLNRGMAFGDKGLLGKAIEDYQSVIARDPLNITAYNNMGALYGKEGMPARAIEAFSRAIAMGPDCAESYYNRGVAYASEGQNDRALEDFTKTIDLNRSDVTARMSRGRIRLMLGKKELAAEDFQIVCESGFSEGCSALKRMAR